MTAQLLVVEDEPLIRQNLLKLLNRHGYNVTEADSVAAAEALGLHRFDLIVSDVRLPGELGTVLIDRARPVPVLIMTSYSDTRDAVEAMRNGAVHYLIKPFDHQELLLAIESALSRLNPLPNFSNESAPQHHMGMISNSPSMLKLFDDMRTVAPLDATVLVLGESGTGKELVARALHQLSPRATQPWIAVNCAAIPDSLMEDELFGHEKGAFTGANTLRKGLVEAADQGTLFLDEIGELPLEAQARLLRLLQEREIRRLGTHETRRVDIRLIAATHRNLEQMVREGKFRADLYFRLHVVSLLLPPLRQRGDDLLLLANQLIQQFCEKHRKSCPGLSIEASQRLSRHSWPGNVRELQNVLEYAVIMCKGGRIGPELIRIPDTVEEHPRQTYAMLTDGQTFLSSTHSPTGISTPASPTPAPNGHHNTPPPALLPDSLADLPAGSNLLEQQFIQTVRQLETGMTETQLAEALGISRKTLWEKRQRLNIPRMARRKS